MTPPKSGGRRASRARAKAHQQISKGDAVWLATGYTPDGELELHLHLVIAGPMRTKLGLRKSAQPQLSVLLVNITDASNMTSEVVCVKLLKGADAHVKKDSLVLYMEARIRTMADLKREMQQAKKRVRKFDSAAFRQVDDGMQQFTLRDDCPDGIKAFYEEARRQGK